MVDSTDRAEPSLSQKDIGKRVLYHPSSDKGSKRGTLRYYGVPEFAEGYWCGIELDEATGKHNGYLYGIHYFQCEDNHGIFVQANKVEVDINPPPKRSHKRTGSGGGGRSSSVPLSPVGQKEFFKPSPPPVKKINTPTLQKALPSQAFNAKLRQLTAKGQKTPVQPLKAFGSEVGNVVVRRKSTTPKAVRSHMRRSSSGENLNTKGLMNGRLVKAASSECVQKASSKEPSPKPFRRSSHENFTAVPVRKTSKGKVQRWPLTSTPVKGDITSTSSSSTSVISTGASDAEQNVNSDQQISTSDVAFLQTPETPPRDSSDSNTSTMLSSGMVSTDDSIIGLQTPVNQLKMQTQNSDFIDSNRVPSPEPYGPQERYQNTLSGSATLSHPLSSVNVPSIIIAKPTDTTATPTDVSATPTDAAVAPSNTVVTFSNTVATPTNTAATPTDTATIPTHSTSINGIISLSSSDDVTDHHDSSSMINDKLLDDAVSVSVGNSVNIS